jgi:UDP-N-acetylmuramyl pentapeptide phosphotransferase/UDP-N-acetylglucosamine-1-phosphate transferase
VNEFVLIGAAAIFGWALTGFAVRAFAGARHRVVPNERSMHKVPTRSGGGLAIVIAVALLWPLWHWPLTHTMQVVLSLTVFLAIVSWIDDYRQLWPLTRIAVQAVAVAIALTLMPENARLLSALPFTAERVLLGLAWLWLINLTKFMDGIDGIAGSEAIMVTLGYVGVAAIAGLNSPMEPLALIIAGATAGYLVWNWHPARIFMGDVGSIPLGFLMGWLMLELAQRGHAAAALILPLYFVADATITLARRIMSGEKPWQAHRTHFYQRAVQGGASVPDVVKRVVVANAALLVLALLSVRSPYPALAAAAVVVLILLTNLANAARSAPPAKA